MRMYKELGEDEFQDRIKLNMATAMELEKERVCRDFEKAMPGVVLPTSLNQQAEYIIHLGQNVDVELAVMAFIYATAETESDVNNLLSTPLAQEIDRRLSPGATSRLFQHAAIHQMMEKLSVG